MIGSASCYEDLALKVHFFPTIVEDARHCIGNSTGLLYYFFRFVCQTFLWRSVGRSSYLLDGVFVTFPQNSFLR